MAQHGFQYEEFLKEIGVSEVSAVFYSAKNKASKNIMENLIPREVDFDFYVEADHLESRDVSNISEGASLEVAGVEFDKGGVGFVLDAKNKRIGPFNTEYAKILPQEIGNEIRKAAEKYGLAWKDFFYPQA